MISFLSNTCYTLSPGIIFPVHDILGIIAYPTNTTDTLIYLKDISINRAIHFYDYTITLKFSDSRGICPFICETDVLGKYTEDKPDYKLDFIDPTTNSICGCMVVTYNFIKWLKSTSYDISNISNDTLYINPTYIYSTNSNLNNLISVNNKRVNTIILTNAAITKDNTIKIVNKQVTDNDTSPHYMTALRIKSSSSEILLKGKSIGFTIAPPASNTTTGKQQFCRVHITTNNNNIIFTDQGIGV